MYIGTKMAQIAQLIYNAVHYHAVEQPPIKMVHLIIQFVRQLHLQIVHNLSIIIRQLQTYLCIVFLFKQENIFQDHF